MNFLQLYTELKSNLGNRSTTTGVCTLDRLKLWLNNAEIEIASAFAFFQTEIVATASMVVGQVSYSVPDDCIAIYDLRDNTVKRRIMRSHYRKFDNVDLSISGDPTHYIRYGNCIYLGPQVPQATNQMQMRYCGKLTAMANDSDDPTLAQPWHECILLGAEYRGWRALGEVKKYIAVKNEFIALVRSRNAEWEIEDGDEEFGLEVIK